jgi:IS5 family transposase
VSRTVKRQVSFADFELMRQGLRLEPLLQAISDFLENQKDMIEQVRCDLTRGLKKAETGRNGLTPQQILRSLVLMRIKNWNYRDCASGLRTEAPYASSRTSIVCQCLDTMRSTAASIG